MGWKAGEVRRIVIVSGSPGAGKSTLAGSLARSLDFPRLSKDVIKETLFDQLGHVAEDERESSRQLGGASMELLWRLAGSSPSVVLEANFRSDSPYERERLLALSPTPVEVFCRVPFAIAAERYAKRAASPHHHPVHVERTLTVEAFREHQDPFSIDLVIEVDTTSKVDIAQLVVDVSLALSS